MTWLVRLYPRAWRERYGDEFSALLREQRWSFGLLVDVLAGAIDARVEPQRSAARAPREALREAEGDKRMFARMMKLKCAGYGPQVTARDQWTSLAIQLGGTVVLAATWMWLRAIYRGNPYLEAGSFLTFLAPFVLSMPFNSLKGRSREAQAAIVGGTLALLLAIALATGFITARL
jgi:hypothetical protein